MVVVCDMDRRVLDLGVAREPCADEPAVPRPAVLRVACRMNADEAAAGTDVSFEGRLLVRVQNVSGRAEEYDGLVPGQNRIAQPRSILGTLHRKAVFGSERLDRSDPLRDRIVAKGGRL